MMMSSFNLKVVIPFYTTAHEIRQKARCHTAASKVTTRIRSYWRGNSDVALDGAGVKPANNDHRDSRQCPTRQSLSPNKSNRIMCGRRVW